MKKVLIVLVSIGLAFGASAQKGYHGGGFHPRPRVYVGIGGGFGPYYRPYSPFYSPFGYGYSPYGYRPYSSARPSRLQLDIQDIQIDYADRIQSVKMDKSISRRERRHRIKDLKYQRDKAINDAKRDYYYNRQDQR